MTYYYLFQNEQPMGPYTIGQVRSMWAAGTINARTHFCRAGEEQWSRLETMVAELEAGGQPNPVAHSRNLDPPIAATEVRAERRECRTAKAETVSSKSFSDGFVMSLIGGVMLVILIAAIFGDWSDSTNSPTPYQKNRIPTIQTHSDYQNASESERRVWADQQAKRFQGSGPYPVTGKDLQEGLDAFYSR